ncbi:unnamed protein product [Urochloa humidicola]
MAAYQTLTQIQDGAAAAPGQRTAPASNPVARCDGPTRLTAREELEVGHEIDGQRTPETGTQGRKGSPPTGAHCGGGSAAVQEEATPRGRRLGASGGLGFNGG